MEQYGNGLMTIIYFLYLVDTKRYLKLKIILIHLIGYMSL